MHKNQYRDLLDTLITPYANKAGLPSLQSRDDTIEHYARNMLTWYVRHDPERLSAFIDRYTRNANSIFQITDKAGTTISLYPRRKHAADTKRRLYLDGKFEHGIKDLKRFILQKVIEDDVKKALDARRQRQVPKPRSVSAFIFNESKKDRLFGSGSFEHDFKNMAIQGRASNALGAAREIITTMTPAEKKDLNSSLKSAGIHTVGDLENLLSRWKGEALSRPGDRTYKRKITRSHSRSFSMSD